MTDQPISPPPPPPPPPPRSPGGVSENRTAMVVLSYLGPLALIPLLVEKEDKEVQWHAKNGLLLFGAEIVLCIGVTLLTSVLGAVIGDFGCLGCVTSLFLTIAVIAINVFCIVKGVKGGRVVIPGISQFADRF